MKYISTRGQAPALDFSDVVLTGLASDGGLYVPESFPQFSPAEIAALAGLPYDEVAIRIMHPFVGDIPGLDFPAMVRETYASFRHRAVAPLKQLEPNLWLLELFHGPTLAFKDFALQLLGRLMEWLLLHRGEQLVVLGATSGDTGSAAIEGLRGRKGVEIVIMHPHGRVSDVQRRQMTTILDHNVHNLALQGTFDDAQAIVKQLFNDAPFRQRIKLGAVNSINWARIMAQIVYYFYAAVALGAPSRAVSFCVPTGNFGDIYAGYVAARMGLPIERLVVATNRNDILARFMQSGTYQAADVHPTISPSMDIQVSSNFERLLFDACDRDANRIHSWMQSFRASGSFTVKPAHLHNIRRLFDGLQISEEATHQTMADYHLATGELLDPHTAIGVKAAKSFMSKPHVPMVCLATAHPAKFPAAVEAATHQHPALPPAMADLFERPERMHTIANDPEAIKAFILSL